MDDLFLAAGADAVNVDGALLDNVEAARRLAFAEEIIAFAQRGSAGPRRAGRRKAGRSGAC
jgi:hypothetical protein